MKKIIVYVLILSVFCISGCQKSASVLSDNSSVTEHIVVDDDTDSEYIAVSSQPSQDTTTNITSDATTTATSNTATESADNTISSDVTNQIIRPEKVTTVYKFSIKTANNEHIKKVYYDSQNGNTLQYCLFLPDDYSADKKYPVILFLHGAGEIGSDNVTQLRNINNMFIKNPDYVSQSILICPQTPEWWRLDREYGDGKGTLTSALHLLQEIQKEYSCDENRIYLTGLSMGGYATWELLEHYGDIFAAAVPVCGYGNEMNGQAFVDIPIRIYHGTADPTVSFSSSQDMYNAIVAAGGQKVELFPLEGVGHDAWLYAYADTTMFDWMFAQDKSKTTPTTINPTVPFRVVDSNGNTVITDDDIKEVDYTIHSSKNSGPVDIELLLTDEGKAKLEKAYTTSGGREFTVYCRLQKIYSFTATQPPIDNIFLISGVFKIDNYLSYYHMINDACFENS